MMKCILIYDDSQGILDICRIVFSKKSYRVETRESCENIIADIDLIKPDIILMDLWIPKLGGERAIADIKNHPHTQHIPVVLFSANVEIDKISKKVNADGYLEKPFDIKALVGTIEKYIS